MDRRFDPRSIVTPYAFAVHPDLLGLPLATPWQRLGAILIDLLIIGLLTLAGGAPLALASTVLLFWLAVRKPSRDAFGKVFRFAVGCLGVLVLTATLGISFGIRHPEILQWVLEDAAESSSTQVEDASGQPVGGERAGAIIDQVMRELGEPPAAESGGAGPEAGVASEAQGSDLSRAALDSIARLNGAVLLAQEATADLQDSVAVMQQQLLEAQGRGIVDWLYGLIDDLGLGFGWGALYLTLTHALWKGTSVGKKVFGTRVVMIDKRPLNLWLSFERAGGYAAGFATGLLGFAQVFWDPNRQAIHDKVSETIVIQSGKKAVPGPWIEEGRAEWVRGRQNPHPPGME